MKSYFTKKEQIVILIVILAIVVILGFKFVSTGIFAKEKNTEDIKINLNNEEEAFNEAEETERQDLSQGEKEIEEYQGNIIVHVSGQVIRPGIVELPFGKRLIDAVEELGGLTLEADEDRINLAKKLQDEEKIYIPKIGEELPEEWVKILEAPGQSNKEALEATEDPGKIDLNLCTKEELNNLPGIGEVLSTRILEYREDNIFKTIEDIMNVSGIGAKKYEALKDLIIVK